MARTSTRTGVLTIGDNLAEKKNLQDLSKRMKDVQDANEEYFLRAGIKLVETDDFNDIDLMKQQWERFVLNIIKQEDREDVRQIIDQLDKLGEKDEPSSEKNSEFKIK